MFTFCILLVVVTHTHPNENLDLPDETVAELKQVVLYLSFIHQDVINLFKDPSILDCMLNITVINANGQPEKGDGEGVLRDVLTHFWHEFFTTLSIGETEKTPHIWHDLQKLEWQAIARVLVFGYKNAKYFPVLLSQSNFILCC